MRKDRFQGDSDNSVRGICAMIDIKATMSPKLKSILKKLGLVGGVAGAGLAGHRLGYSQGHLKGVEKGLSLGKKANGKPREPLTLDV